MSNESLLEWKKECEAIHAEMDQVLRSAWLSTTEERQVRKLQYLALIERRDAAARKFLRPGL
jgi:hypothetical protein